MRAESVYFKTKFSVIAAGDLENLLISMILFKSFLHEKFNVMKKKRITLNINYNVGTVTDSPIQQLNVITFPEFPSVKISVLEGALPK